MIAKTSPATGLGDRVASALEIVGITPERLEKWLGRPCGCRERKERINQLGRWASRVLLGRTEKAEEYFDEMTER